MKDIAFSFHPAGSDPTETAKYLVRIPKGINDKQALLRLISKGLNFPGYFGSNWDALDECLADLSWLEETVVLIWHDDMPLASDRDGARRYLKVLEGVLREPGRIPFRISFPETARNNVHALLLS